jgi:uridylate kinase
MSSAAAAGEGEAEPGTRPRYRRILLKLSGEALMGERSFGLDAAVVERIAADVCEVHGSGVAVCVVVGGGNIFRGKDVTAAGVERASADYMGMLATVMNALALQSVLERRGVATRVLSAIPMAAVCEPYIRRRALRHLDRGRIVVFAAGTGNPFFTTDTAAALRAVEMGCDALLKGTQVDGVYSADPKHHPDATRHERLSYQDVLSENLGVMDTAAVALARDNKVPIVVFSIHEPGSLMQAVRAAGRFTIIQ